MAGGNRDLAGVVRLGLIQQIHDLRAGLLGNQVLNVGSLVQEGLLGLVGQIGDLDAVVVNAGLEVLGGSLTVDALLLPPKASAALRTMS